MKHLKVVLSAVMIVGALAAYTSFAAEEKKAPEAPKEVKASAKDASAKKESKDKTAKAAPAAAKKPEAKQAPAEKLTKEQEELIKKVDKLKPQDLHKKQEDEIVFGFPEAPVTMIEYASLSCTHCAVFASTTFPLLEQEYINKGKLKFYFRDFPLNEPALRGSMLVRCAARPKREPFIKTLFKTQEKWAFEKDYMAKLLNIAKIGGMKEADFKKCMEDKKLEDSILFNRLAAGKVLEVGGTPTLFINGEKVADQSIEALRKQLDALVGEKEKKNLPAKKQ